MAGRSLITFRMTKGFLQNNNPPINPIDIFIKILFSRVFYQAQAINSFAKTTCFKNTNP